MNTLSFMTANFVARELNYNLTEDWMKGDEATQAWFRPEQTFASRFEEMLREVQSTGFTAIDLWTAHLSPEWATDSQIATARTLLDQLGMRVVSLASQIPENTVIQTRLVAIAKGLNTRIIGGGCPTPLLREKRPQLVRFLKENNLIFGYENHPEKNSQAVLEKIGSSDKDVIGIAVDTGWFGTQGYPADKAVQQLADRIVHVHLKDIHPPQKSAGPTMKAMGHETCAPGDGIVPVENCMRLLLQQGYTGGFSFEHEPENSNPLDDAPKSLTRMQSWLESSRKN